MRDALWQRHRWLAATAAAALLAVALFSAPIADIDLWWHLSNGSWIWSKHALPLTDPSLVYPEVNYWARTILQGQWAGQVALFLAYQHWGAWGVILLRAACLAATLALVARRLWTSGAPPAPAAAVLAAAGVVLAGFAADRPQLFSFVLFALVLVLLEDAGRRGVPAWAVVPVLAAWANFHPGVILGAAVAGAWLAAAAFRSRASRNRRDAWLNGTLAVAALAAPLATPNGSRGIEYLVWLEFEPAKQRISEYASPLRYLADLPQLPHLIAYFAFAALLLAVLVRQVRAKPFECSLHSLLLLASLSTYRYIPFAVLFSAPFVAAHFPGKPGATPRRAVAIGFAAVVALSFANELVLRAREGFDAVSERVFPVRLVEAARQGQVSGRIFTSVSWGGYVGWQLAGRARPYIDGRYLMNTARLDDYTHILWSTPRGRALFEQAGFDWVILPYRNAVARAAPVYPLIARLQSDPQWQLRASDETGVVFCRRSACTGDPPEA